MADRKSHAKIPPAVREAYQRGYNDGLRQQGLPLAASAGLDLGPGDALSSLSTLTGLALGHIRITSHDAGKLVHYKQAYRTLEWPWHYTLYTATNYASPRDGLSGLLDKVHKIAEGRLRPSPDTPQPS